VVVSAPAALGETREAEGHVGRRVAVHPKQLAHGLIVLSPQHPVMNLQNYSVFNLAHQMYKKG
jgi:hypothetical protein